MTIYQHIKKNLQLALPISFGQIGQICINLSDNIMVGSIGDISLAAASLANSIFIIIMVFGWGVSSSISPIVSEINIKNNYEKGKILLYNIIIISLLISIILYLVILLLIPIFPYLGQSPKIINKAIPFLRIISLSMIPWLLFESLKKFAEGLSITTPGMIITWLGVILNILLNYILIHGKYGFTKMGMLGAAYASFITRITMLIGLCIFLYKQKKKFIYFDIFKYKQFYNFTFLLRILKIGTPVGLQMLFEVGAFAVASFISGVSGTEQLAAHQIVISLVSTTYMLALGFSVTATIRIGYQYAIKNYIELRRIGWSIILMSSTFMLVSGLIFIILNKKLPLIYLKDKNIVDIASKLLIIASLFQLSDGIQSVIIGALKGIYDVKIPMWISFFSYWIIAIPLGIFLSIYMNMKALGIWIGLGLGLTLSACLLLIRYHNKTMNLLKK